MKRLLISTTAAIVSFVLTRKARSKPKQVETPSVTWISAEDVEVDGPKFEPGQTITAVNPYTGDYAIADYDGTPLVNDIKDVMYDEDDKCYRYLIDEEWYSEAWLELPKYPFMTKALIDEEEGPEMKTELTGKAKERNIQLQIDYWLATLQDEKQAGDDKAYGEATKALEELTAK